jgi:hypothetical protein
MALSKIGKKHNKNTIINLGIRPNPNQVTNKGANAIFGTSCNATVLGYSVLRRNTENAMIKDNGTPNTTERINPPKLSRPVTQVYFRISGKFENSFAMMEEGFGSK